VTKDKKNCLNKTTYSIHRENKQAHVYIPGRAFPNVYSVESLATKHEVNIRAASLSCREASSRSSSSCRGEFPEIFLVPPAPAPCSSNAFLMGEKG